MTTSAKFLSDSAQATEDFGRALSRNLRRGDLLLLIGEMGSGKTTLVRGLAAGLGVEGTVMSPTFQLVRQYPGPLPLAHLDLYRLEDSVDLTELGLTELLDSGVVVVEWGERLAQPGAIRVILEELENGCRQISIEGGGAGWSW